MWIGIRSGCTSVELYLVLSCMESLDLCVLSSSTRLWRKLLRYGGNFYYVLSLCYAFGVLAYDMLLSLLLCLVKKSAPC